MMNKEFHVPFIKSLIVVAVVTVVAMIFSRYFVDYYMNLSKLPQKNIKYSSQNSHFSSESVTE